MAEVESEFDPSEKFTRIDDEERSELRKILDYSIDILLDIQERLLIVHPVGKNGGYFNVF